MKKLTSVLCSAAAIALIAGIAQPAAAEMVRGPCTMSVVPRPVSATSWEMTGEIFSLTTHAVVWEGPPHFYTSNSSPTCITQGWDPALQDAEQAEKTGICQYYDNIPENGPCT